MIIIIIHSVKQNISSMKQKWDAVGNKDIKRTTRKDSEKLNVIVEMKNNRRDRR